MLAAVGGAAWAVAAAKARRNVWRDFFMVVLVISVSVDAFEA